jgi:hypothetical protein
MGKMPITVMNSPMINTSDKEECIGFTGRVKYAANWLKAIPVINVNMVAAQTGNSVFRRYLKTHNISCKTGATNSIVKITTVIYLSLSNIDTINL